uniref:Uncharacterized protein n=1 Tax=Pinguiococcus pyrenoidosus TaxID=172671 RepID=A0A6U0W2P6_9STRA|mmetsp:Transcript_5950/g.23076  ORF Transcript_5950/g.23076 Transcript_5950/m.23076 type:complete len:250 (+) Transcript_5950:449-1198(+)
MGIYEGYVLYCFFALMVLVCGGKSAAVSRIMQRGSPFSIRCCLLCDLKTYKNAEDLLLGLERCVQQLSFVKPFVIFVVAVLVETGVPRAQLLRAAAVVPLVFALMGIVQTYFILKPAMANMAMEMKFLTVKGLVALLAVQQLAINVALTFNTIPEEEGYSQEQEAQRIYAMFVICELVLYSVLMKCVFTPEMFEGVEGPMHEAPKSSVISARTAFLISLRFWRVMAPIEEKDQTLAKSAIEELELLTKS